MEQKFKFEELKIDSRNSGIKSLFKPGHLRKSIIYIVGGAILSLVLHYFIAENESTHFGIQDSLKSLGLGAFIGFFITNSPCSRGRC